jgi:hypothetical protein
MQTQAISRWLRAGDTADDLRSGADPYALIETQNFSFVDSTETMPPKVTTSERSKASGFINRQFAMGEAT